MDRTRFQGSFSPSPFRQSTQRAAPPRRRCRTDRGSRKDNAPPKRDDLADPRIVLVPDDDLFLLLPEPTAAGQRPSASLAAAARKFAAAFRSVWDHIPLLAKCQLLGHWRQPTREVARTLGCAPPRRRPVIQVLHDHALPKDFSTIQLLGHVLAFRASVAAVSPDRLRLVIARTLAEVWRMATYAYGKIMERHYLMPLVAWEREHLASATDEEYDAIQAKLEAEFLAQHNIAVDEVICRWGFAK